MASNPLSNLDTQGTYATTRLSLDEELSPFFAEGSDPLLGERGSLSRRSRGSRGSIGSHGSRGNLRNSGSGKNPLLNLENNTAVTGNLLSDDKNLCEGGGHLDKDEDLPADAHEWIDPYHPKNRAIFSSYFCVGFGLYFILTPIQFYMVNTLSATPAQQTVIQGLQSLPWALKIFCGFVTDSLPIMGLRRKPYFLIGWGIFIICNMVLASFVEPSVGILALFLFLMTLAFVQADVCTDAMIVERSKHFESSSNRGYLQATGYIIRFFGGIIGAVLGAILYNKDSWGWGLPIWGVFVLNGLIPLVFITPFFSTLVEQTSDKPPQIMVQVSAMWELIQRRAVWMPCSFIYIYNVFFLTNPAWNSFLINGLSFTEFEIGMLTLFATVLSYFALVVYRKFLFNTSWRVIYIGATLVAFLFTGLQFILVFGWNKKIGAGSNAWEFVFAMGSTGIVQFMGAIQFLPACRMFLGMCPEGAEGASYAMLTTLSNLAGTVSYSVAAACASIFPVSNEDLSAHHYSGMWKLTLLCMGANLVGLFFIRLLPSGVEEQLRLQQTDYSSKTAGSIFFIVIAVSLLFVISYTIVTIVG